MFYHPLANAIQSDWAPAARTAEIGTQIEKERPSWPWEASVDGLGDALVVAQDLATALCGGFNALYFLRYLRRRQESPSRRVGAAALALANAGALAESLFLMAVYSNARLGWWVQMSLLAPGPWLLARSLPFLGTLFISLLILRARNHRPRGKE
jgi:peptidoglycan biosynthesis protein MviN/MurJ (putative lipid II flippase)